MNIIKFFHIIHNLYFKQKYFIKRKYYSSEGEDLFLKKKLDLKKKGFYVDVGAYHPIRHNNTMILYFRDICYSYLLKVFIFSVCCS